MTGLTFIVTNCFANSLKLFGVSRQGNSLDYKTNFEPSGISSLKSVVRGGRGRNLHRCRARSKFNRIHDEIGWWVSTKPLTAEGNCAGIQRFTLEALSEILGREEQFQSWHCSGNIHIRKTKSYLANATVVRDTRFDSLSIYRLSCGFI